MNTTEIVVTYRLDAGELAELDLLVKAMNETRRLRKDLTPGNKWTRESVLHVCRCNAIPAMQERYDSINARALQPA